MISELLPTPESPRRITLRIGFGLLDIHKSVLKKKIEKKDSRNSLANYSIGKSGTLGKTVEEKIERVFGDRYNCSLQKIGLSADFVIFLIELLSDFSDSKCLTRIHKSFPDILEFFGLELVECHDFSIHTVVMIQVFDAPALESLVICRPEIEFAKTDAHESIVNWNYWQFFHRFKDLFRHDIAHYKAATADIRRVVFLRPEAFGDVIFRSLVSDARGRIKNGADEHVALLRERK